MDHQPKEAGIGSPVFQVFWHSSSKDDLEGLSDSIAISIVEAAEYRLSRAANLIGKPLKGSKNFLWRLRFADYRIFYTIYWKRKEVWILGVEHRSNLYKRDQVEGLVRLAMALLRERG